MKRILTTLSMLLFAVTFMVAQRVVKGTVSSTDGTLIGASVRVGGTTRGTVTDVNGNYSVEVPSGATKLIYSYTGYDTQEITLGASNVVDVTMSEGKMITEAVVTALGISREERSLGYGVTQVKGESVTKSGEVNFVQGLAAKSSGIQVIGSGGTPGASSKILVRGNSSFQLENQPLIVVDGIPYNNETNGSVGGDYPFNANLNGVNNSNRGLDINPADIESINILKGPAASALYGTRAASGVLVITTKKGKSGIGVDFSSNVSFDEVNRLPNLQGIYGQGNGGGSLTSDVGTFAVTPNSWGPKITTPFDNYDNYFQRGVTYNNNVSVSMGDEKTSFRVAYGNTNQTGIVPNTDLKRNSLRLNVTSKINRITLQGTASYVNTKDTKAQNGSNLSGVMLALTRMPRDFNIIGGDGANGYDTKDGLSHSYFPIYDNPLWSAYNNPMTGNVDRFTGGLSATAEITTWLDITGRITADAYTDGRKQIFAIGANDPPSPVGEVWENNQRWREINSDIYANIKPKLNDTWSANFLVGTNLNSRNYSDYFQRGRNLSVPGFYNLSNASELYNSQGTEEKKLAGIYADVQLAYKNVVYLGLTGRNDWASTFGEDARKKGFFYPSASLAYVFSESIGANDILSFGKLRASWANAGREPATYRTKTYFNAPFVTDGFTDGLGFPYGGQNGFGQSSLLGNNALEPETNTTTEFGINVRLFKNLVNLDVNYYSSLSDNLLVTLPIAESTGFSNFYSNAGAMTNKGWEVELGLNLVERKDLRWTINANFTKNVNEVTELPAGVDEIDIETAFSSIGSFAIVGQPYGAFYGTRWKRNDQGQLLIGANGLAQVDPLRGNLGNPYPDFTAGVGNNLEFKGVRLNFLFDIRQGGSLWNGTRARLNRIGKTPSSADRARTYIIPGVKAADGTANDIAISALSYHSNYVGDGGLAATEQAIQDGSWVRLRELTLGYTFPMGKMGKVKGLNIYATGRNLWLQTDYDGVDPETSLTGAGSNVGGFDYFNMPSTKSFIVGLNLNF